MIDEAMGKILGMAMAYGVSGLGLFLAYVNYRKRIVKAERVMSGTAWLVLALTLLAIGGGVLVVSRLAASAPSVTAAPSVEVVAEPPTESAATAAPTLERTGDERPGGRWPAVGILVPAAIFLFATVVTAALHRHFSTQSPPAP